MPHAMLMTVQQLADSLDQPNTVILDCRFALDNPAYGQQQYQAGHIPGAQFADLEQHLSAPVIKGVTGRHPLPEPESLAELLRQWGLNQDSRVVVYDDGNGAFAARAWWLLAWLGKDTDVWLLDGGFSAWQQANLPISSQAPQAKPSAFKAALNPALTIDAKALAARLNEPNLNLLDARALARFKGEVEPLDPVAGHIPGAVCAAFTDNLASTGHFLTPEALKQRFAPLLKDPSHATIVAYCGSGVTACHTIFALSLAGLENVQLYAGSWSEWITDPSRPVARG